jgi:hypothetical protein
MSRSERIGVSTEPLRPVAGTQEWCSFHERDVETADQFKLMGGRTTREPATDDECRFHLAEC